MYELIGYTQDCREIIREVETIDEVIIVVRQWNRANVHFLQIRLI